MFDEEFVAVDVGVFREPYTHVLLLVISCLDNLFEHSRLAEATLVLHSIPYLKSNDLRAVLPLDVNSRPSHVQMTCLFSCDLKLAYLLGREAHLRPRIDVSRRSIAERVEGNTADLNIVVFLQGNRWAGKFGS